MQRSISPIHLKRIVVSLAAAALFGGSVHIVLVVANVAEPAATTVYGFTDKRIWSTVALVLSLVAVIGGGLALVRPNNRFGGVLRRLGVIVALVAGFIALVNGWLVLVTANGGPNSGNGVVAGAMALVLGLIGVVMGGLALVRSRRTV